MHFRLHLPPSLRMHAFQGEESSVVKADVQAIHDFANTAQLTTGRPTFCARLERTTAA